MEIVNKRNTESMALKLQEMSTRIYEQEELVLKLMNTLSGLYARINQLEEMVLGMKVRLTGTGASE